MSSPLTPAMLAQVHAAINLIAQMFFTAPVTINTRTQVRDSNGEGLIITSVPYNLNALYGYDVGTGGRYHTVEHSDMGQILRDGWKLYFLKSDVDAAIPAGVNSEADSITIPTGGKEYEIRMWSESAQFSTLGFLLYECDVHFTPGA